METFLLGRGGGDGDNLLSQTNRAMYDPAPELETNECKEHCSFAWAALLLYLGGICYCIKSVLIILCFLY